jgi:hypothetical protein
MITLTMGSLGGTSSSLQNVRIEKARLLRSPSLVQPCPAIEQLLDLMIV